MILHIFYSYKHLSYYMYVMIFHYVSTYITYMQQIKKENLKILANRIKELRVAKSKSLNKFCFSKGNVTSATWSRVENAIVDVKFTTLIQMCAMLEIKPEELFKGINFNYSLDE